jgi:transposase
VIPVGSDELLVWAVALDGERLWAVEDCRQLTRWLERQLLGVGEELVRVPPRLTVPERRAGRVRGKSDPIDALAIARAAIREPGLSRPRPGERVCRETKLLVDHREDLVAQRTRSQQRLRWHLHQLDPTFEVPLRRLDRASHLERVARWLARREQELQVRIARELVTTIRQLNRSISELDRELEQRTIELAPALLELPGCAAVTAAKLLAEIGPIDRFRNDAQLARHSGVAHWKPAQDAPNATDSTAAATANSTPLSTGSPSPRPATTRPPTTTSNANAPKARTAAKHSATSNDSSSASSSTR